MVDQVKLAWITGGSAGIGLAIAHALGESGYFVVISARNEKLLSDACEELRKSGRNADHVLLDVTRRSDVNAACRTILDRHGRIDVLVNNAGFNIKARKWEDLIPEEFNSVVAANLTGTFNAIHAVLPAMRAQKAGTIVNVSSVAGKDVNLEGGVAYSAAKHGVVVLTELVNQSEFRHGIRACVVAPGGVDTRAHSTKPQAVRETMLRAEDVARAVRFAVETPPHAAVYEIDIRPIHRWDKA